MALNLKNKALDSKKNSRKESVVQRILELVAHKKKLEKPIVARLGYDVPPARSTSYYPNFE